MASEAGVRVFMLFNRLLWPSAMVRDGACSAIVKLLTDSDIGEEILAKYMQWISELELESSAANALLPIILANESNRDFDLPNQDAVKNSIAYPSLLSAVLMNELWPTTSAPDFSKLHSGDAPIGFKRCEFFDKHVEAFLPPIYNSLFVNQIKQYFSFNLSGQWAFEWEKVVERTGIKPSDQPLRHWLGVRSTEPRHSCVDMKMSEIYRSAFLRALAWAVDSGRMPSNAAFQQTAVICPVDIDLFKISPKPKPSWWPIASSSESKIDTSATGIWEQVEKLWELQKGSDGFVHNIANNEDHILAAASGLAGDEETVYDIEIRGAFQKCGGSRIPDAESVFEFLLQNPENASIRATSSVRFSGSYKQNQLSDVVLPIEDWSFVPATSTMFIQPRWQFWRMRRDVRIPSPVYSLSDLDIGGDETGVVVTDANGQVIARWTDWTHGLREKRVAELPTNTGEMLTMSRSVVQQFAEETSSNFCWVVRLNGFARKDTLREYQNFAEFRIFGASAIIQS